MVPSEDIATNIIESLLENDLCDEVNLLPVDPDHEIISPDDCKDVNGGVMFATTSFEGKFLI